MTTRADMGQQLDLSPSSPTKTFVVEAHTDDPQGFLEDLFGARNLDSTEDAYLYKVHSNDGILWVDQLDERFWNIHTDLPAQVARTVLKKEVESRRELDWVWLPSDHL